MLTVALVVAGLAAVVARQASARGLHTHTHTHTRAAGGTRYGRRVSYYGAKVVRCRTGSSTTDQSGGDPHHGAPLELAAIAAACDVMNYNPAAGTFDARVNGTGQAQCCARALWLVRLAGALGWRAGAAGARHDLAP